MMGKQPRQVPKPCYYGLCLEERIAPDHLLRKIHAQVDFDFTYDLVRPYYGVKGNVSVPPPVLLKMMWAVDDLCGVITAVATTAGDVEENAKLMDLVDQHEQNTGRTTETVVADMQYGTVENFRACHQRGIHSHMADLTLSQANKPCTQGIFKIEQFLYDPVSDSYRCPAGQTLRRRKHKKQRRAYEYACATAVCPP